jgi:hypothetical protein
MGLNEDEELELLELEEQEYQESLKNKPQEKMSFGEGLGRSALEALPIAGGLFGGAVGLAAGPVGAVGGAGLGAAGGKALQQAGEKLFFDEGPKTRGQQYKELGMEGLAGAAGEGIGQSVMPAMKLTGKGLTKVGHALTGVPEQEIVTYANRAKAVKALAKESDASTMEAADQIRKQFNTDIRSTIGNVNNQISEILKTSNKQVKSQPIYDSLENYKSKLDPSLWTEDIKQIENLQNRILESSQGGNISAAKANEIKQFLQDRASTAYRNGEMFQIGKEAANAAKSGAGVARELVDQVEPNVTKLNATLKKFHDIEESMNPNILKIGGPEAALTAAGSGGNPRNIKALEELGQMTGAPMLEQAQNLSAMRTFTNPPILPMDTTGKSYTRMAVSSGIGGAIGGPVGMAAGAAATSPMALKTAIELGSGVGSALEKVPMKEQMYKGLMQKYFSAPDNQVKEQPQEKQNPDTSMIMDKIKGSEFEQVLQNALNKGKESFAAANYVLGNRNAKYQKILRGDI